MTTLNEKLNNLSPERRASVQAHADELIAANADDLVIIDPVTVGADHGVISQRDEYRMHMERYQGEVAELKAENAAIVKAFRNMALDSVRLQSELDFSKALLEQSEDHDDIGIMSEVKEILGLHAGIETTLIFEYRKFFFLERRFDSKYKPDKIAYGKTLAELVENYKARGSNAISK